MIKPKPVEPAGCSFAQPNQILAENSHADTICQFLSSWFENKEPCSGFKPRITEKPRPYTMVGEEREAGSKN